MKTEAGLLEEIPSQGYLCAPLADICGFFMVNRIKFYKSNQVEKFLFL